MGVVRQLVCGVCVSVAVWLTGAGSASAQVTFGPPTSYPTGAATMGIALADLNHDNHLDMVVTTEANDTIRVRLGDGTGSFGPAHDFDTGNVSYPCSIAIADFNSDGHPDVATANCNQFYVSVFLGDGAGGFGPAAHVPAGNGSAGIVAADLNGDGAVDLATTNLFGGTVTVLLGSGSGTFTEASGSPLPLGGDPWGIRAADLNGDHILDLVAAARVGNLVRVWFGVGDGSFVPVQDIPVSPEPFDVGLLDIDGDHILDLIVTVAQGNRLDVFQGLGDGSFSFVQSLPTGIRPIGLTIADLSGEGTLDVAVANSNTSSPNLSIFLGDSGTLVPSTTLASGGVAPGFVEAADLNEDGKPDLAAVHATGSSDTTVLLNQSCCVVTVSLGGAGTGMVYGGPSGISCGTDCTGFIPMGSSIDLEFLPSDGSIFSGLLCGGGACGATITSDVTITAIFDPVVLTLGPPTLPDGTVGVPYSQALTIGGNGTGPYYAQWSSLPAGLEIVVDATLTIAGTPTQGGTTPFTITVIDGGTGAIASFPYTLTIGPASTSTTALPAFATYDASGQSIMLSATVSGVPTVNEGTVTFTVRDAASNPIGAPVTSGAVTDGAVTAIYTVPGGTPVQTLMITAVYNGSLPAYTGSSGTAALGVVPAGSATAAADASAPFNASNQSVTLSASVTSPHGTVDGGTVTFTVQTAGLVTVGSSVTASVSGGTANAAYTLPGGTPAQTLTVTAAYGGSTNFMASMGSGTLSVGCVSTSIVPAAAPLLRVGQPFSVTFSAPVFGDATFSFAGAPPPGLAFAGSTLSGTPTALGHFTIDVTAASATGGCSTTRPYALDVQRGPVFVAAAGGGSPRINVYDATGALTRSFTADASFTGGVRVAMGDVTADGVDDIITAPGGDAPSPTVSVFDGASGAEVRRFDAYPSPGGVYVAAGDVNGDGAADIVTARNGSPHVKVFDGRTGALVSEFMASSSPVAGGVRVAVGDLDGDGAAEIITAAEPGGPPEVRVYSGAGALRTSFMAYHPAFAGGVYVAAGDVDGDGLADIVTGSDAGGGPHVMAFSGVDLHVLRSFYAYEPAFPGGVRVAVSDLNLDGRAEIVTASGAGGPHVRVWDGLTGNETSGFFAFETTFGAGVFVAAPPPQSRMAIDVPGPGATVPPVFLVGGWAGMGGASADSGIDTIHAWALPVGGGSPVFAGATVTGVSRPDVAAQFGGNFAEAGYNLMAGPLPSGTYDLVLVARSAGTGTWAMHRVVRIVVTP